MSKATQMEERILILAPMGHDVQVAHQTLACAGLSCTICSDSETLCATARCGASLLLLAEEALTADTVSRLNALLSEQPPWSNLPLVLLAGGGAHAGAGMDFLETLDAQRKAVVLERPVRPMTLVTTVQSALSARRRQYEVRDLLAQLEELNSTLEHQVKARTAELQRANARLKREIAERRRLARENLEISTQERQWFAQELHDGLCQQLSSLSFMTATLKAKLDDNAELLERVERLAALSDRAVREARTLARGLFPAELETRGLAAALEGLANDVADAYRITCEVVVEGQVQLNDLLKATNLYRIAQEALSNAIRHGRASRVVITLDAEQEDALVLSIADNGVGIEEKPVAKNSNGQGIGMQTMQRRAHTVGATLSVKSLAAGGTMVECRLPLKKVHVEPEMVH